ncbi:hypothetical protein [Teichococcus vastitatis]|uniref:hypothetical protein n=1 Tax=Teichococcus vastitatis TaxID=2307076 RepID=UPI0038D1E10C
MSDAPDEERAHADVDHGPGDVAAAFVVADQAAPAGHPAEGPLHDSAARQNLEALLVCQLAHYLDDKVIVGAASGEVLQPGPSLRVATRRQFFSG